MGLLGDYLPDWLPEDADKREAARMGLLNMGAAMMASRGNFGNALGNGLLAGGQTYQHAMQQLPHQQLQKMQVDKARRDMTAEEQIQAAGKESYDGTNGFNTSGFLNRVMAIDPLKGLSLQATLAKETPFNKVDPKDYTPESVAKFAQSRNFGDLMPARKMEVAPSGQVFNPYSIQPGQVLADPNKPFALGPNGVPMPNTGYQNFEIAKARAGKTDVNLAVNTEKGFLGEVAKGVGTSVENSMNQAKAAVGTINNIGQIRSALDSGKIITGPGADTKIMLKQLGVSMGLGGKDDAETLANTRSMMQAMAGQELSAAEAMKGQGAITENERTLLKRAASGDITMTAPEIKALTQTIEKTARFKIQSHQQNVQRLSSNPHAGPIVDFMRVDEPPMYKPAAPQTGAKGTAPIKFLGFE